MSPNNPLGSNEQGTTTVLDAGTVEARGMGTKASSRDQISREIQEFLTGEAKLSFHAETRAFFTVWIFITRLPAPTWVDLHPGFLMRGMTYFPAAGALVGVFVSVFFDLANVTLGLPSIISATMCNAASFWVTGCFHEDGLADASDGLGGGWTRTQILKIMTDTRLGTFGCAALVLHTVMKVELLALLGPSFWNFEGHASGAGPALVVMHSLARLTAPYLIKTRAYVDEAGPKSKFYSFMIQAKHLVSWYRVFFAILTCFGISTLLYGPIVSTAMICVVLFAAHLSGSYAEYILGGVMGDYLGATICLAELLVLTMILSKDHAMSTCLELTQTFQEGDAWMEAATRHDQPIGVLIRFLVVIAITRIWCRSVGHPNIVVASATNDQDGTSETNAPSSGRQAAERVCKAPDSIFQDRYDAVRLYLDSLAKPVGSLGTLEDFAARLAALQQTTRPVVDPVACLVFAGDHGVAKALDEGGEGCSSYPQAVTRSVLVGLERGIAGASLLAKSNNVSLRVIDVGVVGETLDSNNVVCASSKKLRDGTKNFCAGPAMTAEQVQTFIRIGRDEVAQCASKYNTKVIVLGEVGIGNTTSSSALIAQITDSSVEDVCGGGATLGREIDETVVAKKIAIVKRALKLHGASINDATDALARLGGAEIAALVGAILEASECNIALLVDGFIVTAAALVAANITPSTCRAMFFSSKSAEKGQVAATKRIQDIAASNGLPRNEDPALSMNLRMGEATAALLAVPILRSSAAVLSDMGTIEEILKS